MASDGPRAEAIGAAAAEVAARLRRGVVEVHGPGGGGSGTIWRPDGMVVTNHHVVAHDRAEVVLEDGRRFEAEVTRRDPDNDLALLRVPARDLPAVTVGDARRLRVGELVLAVGNPFGVRGAVTWGVVSRPPAAPGPQPNRELLVADVLLGPGNSGGPLADSRGRVVGINAMVAGGLALAVPAHLAESLLAAPRERPTLGVGLVTVALPPAQAAAARGGASHAALVANVSPDSPAERAGLLVGDVLLALDGAPVDGSEALVRALAAHPGGPMRLSLLRGGQPRELLVATAQPERRAA